MINHIHFEFILESTGVLMSENTNLIHYINMLKVKNHGHLNREKASGFVTN